jgi:hypothetical protein
VKTKPLTDYDAMLLSITRESWEEQWDGPTVIKLPHSPHLPITWDGQRLVGPKSGDFIGKTEEEKDYLAYLVSITKRKVLF